MLFREQLSAVAERLAHAAHAGFDKDIVSVLNAVAKASDTVGKSSSGSWLGYFSRIYYEGMNAPPAAARFSQEWGLSTSMPGSSRGAWHVFDGDEVFSHILQLAGGPDLSPARELAESAERVFLDDKDELLSILRINVETGGGDDYLDSQRTRLDGLSPTTAYKIAAAMQPSGTAMSRDTTAISQGAQIPPHIAMKSELRAIGHAFAICDEASRIARRIATHLERKSMTQASQSSTRKVQGSSIFIGHGRSLIWRVLENFLEKRLDLKVIEFNSVSTAGINVQARLAEMLDDSAFAFVVMTPEDEDAYGKLRARMNVVHEVGYFQGRLGFERAVVMLEEGCEEFSNIIGLGQIRFPKGNIEASFEEVRRVLEREKIV